MTEKRNNSAGADSKADKAIHDAMRAAGWVFPKTPPEIEAAERTLAEKPVRLPDRLADPLAVLARPSRRIRIKAKLSAPQISAAEQNLAQAAREGTEIPPDVQDQMKRDRKSAKGDANE